MNNDVNKTMIKTLTSILTVFALTLILGCDSRIDKINQTKQETPQALQDNELEIKSYKRGSDLTEELYAELVDKSPALKKLEEDLEELRRKPNDLTEKFDSYEGKSYNYYRSADHKATAIKDSLLKRKVLALIDKSKNNYANKTAELSALLKSISQNNATLSDRHEVLKIVLTLPLIEKYQSDNLPDKKQFKGLVKEQEKLIEGIDSITPKY